MKILIVDDSELLRGYLEKALSHMGYEYVCAPSAGEALGIISERRHEFDVLLLDVGLPDMNGVELSRQILAAGCDSPVVFMTGNAGQSALHSSLAEIEILPKPFGVDGLRAALTKALLS